MVVRRLAVAVVMLAMVGVAHAESPKLDAARKAIAAVRYDDAQALLVGALQDGGNSPTAMAEIYRLSASTAVVLDQPEVAEQYYRRWLAIDPAASLSGSLAPKLRTPFISAQAYMSAHGRLSARTSRPSASVVEVIIESDPLNMAVAVALDTGATLSPRAIGADRRTRLEAPAGATIVAVVVLDELGNRLTELAIDPATIAPPPAIARPKTIAAPRVGMIRRPTVWLLTAAALTGAGFVFGSNADGANADLDAAVLFSEEHFFGDVESARDRRDLNATIANVAFLAGGACLATALVMHLTRPDETRPVVTPIAAPGALGLSVSGAF